MKRSRGIIVLSLLLLVSIVHGVKPDSKTIWTNATPTNRLEPGGSKKNTGYIAGERPGFKTWNWLIYNLGLWTDYLEDVTDTLKISSTVTNGHIGQTGNIGIGESTPTAKVHIVSTGTGAAFQIDTTQQDKAIYTSSSGVVEIASMTVVEQTVTNQTITSQSVDTLTVNTLITSPKSAIVDVQEATTTLKAQIDIKMNDAPNVVVSTHIAANAVDTSEINNDAIEAGKIAASGVDANALGNTASYANAQVRYYSCPGSTFHGDTYTDEQHKTTSSGRLRNNDGTFAQRGFVHPVPFIHGDIVTRITLYYSRPDGAASIQLDLWEMNINSGVATQMATVNATSTGGGAFENTTTTITNPNVDNDSKAYYFVVFIDNNDSVADTDVFGANADTTYTKP